MLLIIMPIMRSTVDTEAGFLQQRAIFAALGIEVESDHYLTAAEFMCNWAVTTSSKRSSRGCFDPSLIAVFTPPITTNCAYGETAPESIITRPNSSYSVI